MSATSDVFKKTGLLLAPVRESSFGYPKEEDTKPSENVRSETSSAGMLAKTSEIPEIPGLARTESDSSAGFKRTESGASVAETQLPGAGAANIVAGPKPAKKSMLSKFKKAGNLIAMSNRMVKLRPTEVQYYNSAFEIFGLDFEKDHTKPTKSEPDWKMTQFKKFGSETSNVGPGKKKAPLKESSEEEEDSEDEDLSLGGFTFGSKAVKRNISLDIDDDKSTSEIDDDKSNAEIDDVASIGPATSPKPSASMNVENDTDQGMQTVANSKTQQQATARSDTLVERSDKQSESLLENLSFDDSACSSQTWGIQNRPSAVGMIEKAHKASDKTSITTEEPFPPTEEKSNDLVLTLETIAFLSKGDRLCWKCLGEVQNDWIACKHCGTDLFKKKCGNCGNPIKSDWVQCEHCGKKPRKKNRIILNPNKYLSKRMSILSFWEFKNEVRKMKEHWKAEAVKWVNGTGAPDTAFVISSANGQRMNFDRGASPSKFSGYSYRSAEGLWDPQDIFLAPVDSGRRYEYRSSRFDMAAKLRKVVKTVSPFSLPTESVKGPALENEPVHSTQQDEEGEKNSSRQELHTQKSIMQEELNVVETQQLCPVSIFEAIATDVLKKDPEVVSHNHNYRLNTASVSSNRKDHSAHSHFVLNGFALPGGDDFSNIWFTRLQTPRATLKSNDNVKLVHRYSQLIARAEAYNERHSRNTVVARQISRQEDLQLMQRPLTEGGQRRSKGISSEGMRDSWMNKRPDTQSSLRPWQVNENEDDIIPTMPSLLSQAASPLGSIDSSQIALSPLVPVFQPHIDVTVKSRQSLSNEPVNMHHTRKDANKTCIPSRSTSTPHRKSAASLNMNHTLLPSQHDEIRGGFSTPSHCYPRPYTVGAKQTSRPSNFSCAIPNTAYSPRPPQSARGPNESPLRFRMGRVGDGELMSMGVKAHNRTNFSRDPVRIGLATPRRNPQSERDPRRQRRSATVRDNTFSYSQKILQIVDGSILLPSGQLRNGPLRDVTNKDDAPIEELDACDLFAQFADVVSEHIPTKSRVRMKKEGYLACLDFLGFLKSRAKGRAPGLISACRLTPMEALEVFDSVLDCTWNSDDEDDEAEGDPVSVLARDGLTELQFEAVLQALDMRISRAEPNFNPFNAAVMGSDSVENLLQRSQPALSGRSSLSPRNRSESPHRYVAVPL